jgi:hypothetical protein
MAIKLIGVSYPVYDTLIKDFIIDTEADVAILPECDPGSTAVVAATGNVYIVNASGKWVELGAEEG